jgi:uridine kinase
MILLIDGRSGSGKSELATAIAAGTSAQLVRLDDLYPGWRGLADGSDQLPFIITEHRWRRWDWPNSRYEEWHELDPARDLIVEGCGSLSRASRSLADFALWVEHPVESRRQRAIDREPAFAEHWDEWAAQEDAFIELEHPESLADAVVDGADVSVQLPRWRAMFDPARVEE